MYLAAPASGSVIVATCVPEKNKWGSRSPARASSSHTRGTARVVAGLLNLVQLFFQPV